MEKKLVEGLWDCPYCGAKGISGLKKHCPACSHPQDEGTKFYVGEEVSYIDEEKAKDYGNGADWTCAYCGSLNKHDQDNCSNCGAPREDNKGDYFDNQEHNAEKAAKLEKEHQAVGIGVKKKSNGRGAIIGVIAIVLILLMVFLMMPKSSTAEVTAKAWDIEQEIEQYGTVEEEGWELPDGATVLDSSMEVHHYEQVLDHYEDVEVEKSRQVLDHYDTETSYVDNGDGTFSEETSEVPVYVTEYYTEWEEEPVYVDEPVYQPYYLYIVDKWSYERSVITSGTTDDPVVGEVTLSSNEREGQLIENYCLTFEGKKTYEVYVDYDTFMNYNVGDSAKITVKSGTVTKIDGNAI